jgi:hypothetical protein
MAVARLELEDARGEENQLAPGSVVKILGVAFGGLAEKNGVAPEGFRDGPPSPLIGTSRTSIAESPESLVNILTTRMPGGL